MKKILLSLLLFILVTPVIAVQNSGTGTQTGTPSKKVSPTGNQVQNQVQTQNQGAESQLQVNTQENLGTGSGEGLETRSQNAIRNMSEVAKQVQEMLQIRTTGGIGDQVRTIAREQNQAQEQIENSMNKMENKNVVLKKLFGPDYKSIKNLNQLIEENNLRIQQLEELLNQVQNYADTTQIQETIQSILSQNTALQERIQEEERIGSIFGWLVKFFN